MAGAARTPSRLRVRWGMVLLVLLLMVGVVFRASWWAMDRFLHTHPLFQVRRIQFAIPDAHLARRVQALVSPWLGANYWTVRRERRTMERHLRDLPVVREATIITRFPHFVSVRVQPRRPCGQLRVGEEYFLFDEEGVLFDSALEPWPHVPLVYGLQPSSLRLKQRLTSAGAQAALRCLRAIQKLQAEGAGIRVRAVSVSPEGLLQVRWEDGLLVRLGAPLDLEEKLKLALKIRHVVTSYQGIEYLDVSAPEVPVWKPASES